jgi:hypothetical protein
MLLARWASVAAFLWVAVSPTNASAAVITGTVKDVSGSSTPRAHIEISGGDLAAPLTFDTDAQGRFSSPDLKPGSYTLKVTADGFEPNTQTISVSNAGQTLVISLQVATLHQEVTVEGKVSNRANNDPVYRQLRDASMGLTFQVQDVDLKFDVASFHLGQGTLTFLKPVNGQVTGAIFVGHGHFTLKPAQPLDAREILRRAHTSQVDEDFSTAVFRYSGNFNRNLAGTIKDKADEPAAASVFAQWQERVRHRREHPLGFTESILNGSDMDNVDAEVVSWIYNPLPQRSFFQAYIRGDKHKDLRFYVRARGGAIPSLSSPEEVGLVNFDPEGLDDGIWYLSHAQAEYPANLASSQEERRFVVTRKFKIETVLGNNDHLTSIATVTFEPLIAGERVVRFQLLPNLRVTRVTGSDGAEVSYIQESRKADGSFYAILPAPAELKKEYSLTIEYSGDKVVTKAGNGSFYIDAREAWYPNLNSFSDRALYDLTFRIPKRYHLISVGNLESESVEEGQSVTHWVTPKPVFVAGFNYGDYKKIQIHDDQTGYDIAGYYLPDLPDFLAHIPAAESIAPGAMTKYALDQTRAQLEVCTIFFGKSPFNTLAITEQPNFNFGQSWPNLVYLPISAYLDSTQRWELFNRIDNKFTAFVQEVTPHEVAHQWWGHTVGWASYHDQWLSEGFAEFSAGLFLQQAVGPKWQKDYVAFWERLRKEILEKNQFGVAPNDAGPLWLGLRLMSPRSESAYQYVTYPKGAYVLAMLRSLFYSNKDHDKAFIEMMHDFVDFHRDIPASTESFKAIAEKHMPHSLDLENNGRLDWFFREWVYGTEVPHYEFEYQTSPGSGGKTKVHLSITQSQVSDNFVMSVPIFGDFGKGFVRLGQLPVVGNATKTYDFDFAEAPKKIELNTYKEILVR